MKELKTIVIKFYGAIFYGSLLIINFFTKICPEINTFLIFMTFLCLFISFNRNKFQLN
jgi:hypothetical protein